MTKQLTLSDFLGEQLGDSLNGPALTSLLLEIAGVCTKISALTTKGALVDIEDTIKGFNSIMDGDVDKYPEAAFNLVGTIEDAIAKGDKMLAESK